MYQKGGREGEGGQLHFEKHGIVHPLWDFRLARKEREWERRRKRCFLSRYIRMKKVWRIERDRKIKSSKIKIEEKSGKKWFENKWEKKATWEIISISRMRRHVRESCTRDSLLLGLWEEKWGWEEQARNRRRAKIRNQRNSKRCGVFCNLNIFKMKRKWVMPMEVTCFWGTSQRSVLWYSKRKAPHWSPHSAMIASQ